MERLRRAIIRKLSRRSSSGSKSRFDKIGQYSEKTDQYRVSAGKQLVELQARIETSEAGKGVKWWVEYAANFKNRSRRDAQRVMALARSDDPGAAAEEERAKNRAAVAAHRKRAGEVEPQPGGTTYSKSQEYRVTEDDYAAQYCATSKRRSPALKTWSITATSCAN